MRYTVIVLTLSIVMISISCNESLPVYQQPGDVLEAEVIPLNLAKDTVLYEMLDQNNPNLITVQLKSPQHAFEIRITNMFDETIQDNADIQGTLRLQWEQQPQFTTELPLAATSVYSSHYDPQTGLITLNPGDTLILRAFWNFKLEGSEWAFSKQNGTDGPPISGGGNYYRYHLPMKFKTTLRVKIFRSLSFVDSAKEKEYTVNFKGLIIPPP